MSEVITETILPGTYIEVRAEGLLTIGAIATGNVGIVGTAERGDAAIKTLSSSQDAKAAFCEPGPWDPTLGDANSGARRHRSPAARVGDKRLRQRVEHCVDVQHTLNVLAA